MTDADARIRPFVKDDKKRIHFTVGKATMEGLTVANRKVTMHPLTIAAWIALSCILIQWLEWWPQPGVAWWTYLKPLPAFASWSVPLMFLADWFNRPYFEDRMQAVLRGTDLVDIEEYYNRSPASGLWILEYAGKFVGFIAIDASSDALVEETVQSAVKAGKTIKTKGKGKGKDTASEVASIRHFFVHEEYRSTLVQDDLLEFALKHVFTARSNVKTVRATDSALTPWITQALQSQGFVMDSVVGQQGMLKWPIRSRILTKKRWEKLSQNKNE